MNQSITAHNLNTCWIRDCFRWTGMHVGICVTMVAILSGLAGCGGGSGSGGASGNKTVSIAQRTTAIGAVNAMFQAMPHTDRTAEVKQIAAFMATRPEFEASGVSTNACAWGRFTDGRLLIVVDNRTGSAVSRTVAPQLLRKSRAAGTGLPEQISAHLYDAMGTYFSHPAQAFWPTVAAHGYQIAAGGAIAKGTIEDLKAVHGDGLFYMDAHGGNGTVRSGNTEFCVWTGSQFSAASEEMYAGDLNTNKLVYMCAITDLTSDQTNGVSETHYAITPQFVSSYMHFGSNSLVFINACSSDDTDFKTVCINAGAGVYLGWTSPVGDNSAYGAAIFLFDRMLGDNNVAPTDTPAKPPLNWTELQTAMAATIDPTTSSPYDTSPAGGGRQVSMLIFTPGNGDLGVIVPSIHTATVDPVKGEVTLIGIFGPTLGTVEVYGAGTALLVKTWSATQVVAAITPGVAKILLRVNGRPSNPFSLITVNLSPTSTNVTAGAGVSLTASVTGEPDATVISYHWLVTGGNGTLTSGVQTGTSFDSSSSSVDYTANGNVAIGAKDTITVQAYLGAVGDPNRKLIGPASASITIADVAYGDMQVTITGSSFPVTGLSNASKSRILHQAFAQEPSGTSGRFVVDSLHNIPVLSDAVNTLLDFTTSGPHVNQVVDMAPKVLGLSQLSLSLDFLGGGVDTFYVASGSLTVTATNYRNAPTDIKFTATCHLKDLGSGTVDCTITGWLAGVYAQ